LSIYIAQGHKYINQKYESDGQIRPAVLMHGIGASNDTMIHVESVLHSLFPGIYILAIQMGNGFVDSIMWNMNYQVETMCNIIASDPNLKHGFNLMGFSQGGLITRGFVERCNYPPVYNYISWVSPQGGQFGVPNVDNGTFNELLTDIADCCVYQRWAQNYISVPGYWRDPYAEEAFIEGSLFLADISNFKDTKNETYKQNLLSLQNMLISFSAVDETLVPKETGWFEFFAPNTTDTIIPLEDTPFWQEDFIGLKALNESNRLHKFITSCAHGDYSSSCFDKYFMENVVHYFNNTLPAYLY